MLRKVAALAYSSHSTTILISFVVATRRLYQYKSKLIPKRDEGNTAPPSLNNKQKKTTKKDFLRVNLVYSFFDFASSTVILSRQLTIAISHIQYPTRSTDTTRRHQYIPCSTPSPDFTREPISPTGQGGFLLHFSRREVILLLAFYSLLLRTFPFRLSYSGVFFLRHLLQIFAHIHVIGA